MMKTSLKALFLFILITGATKLCAQKKFDVNIQIPTSLKSKGFSINYDDGVKTYAVTDSFIKNRLEFNGKFGSKYATLTIKYTANDSVSFEDSYFIGTKPAEFDFLSDSSTLNKNPFKNCKVRNALEIDQSKMSIKRSVHSRDAINQMNIFWKANASLVGRVDSVTQEFYNNLDFVDRKDLEFIKKNRDNYYSFWRFRTQIVPNNLLVHKNDSVEIQKLLNIFNTIFPKKYTSTPEGQNLHRILAGRLFVKKNTIAPGFEIKGIQGNNIRLKDYRSKYVLLDFWASWCRPCRQMVPHLKELYQKYHSKGLEIIGISADTDSSLWKKAVRDEGLDSWANILNKEYNEKDKQAANLDITYAIDGYPTTILIDKKGKIIGRFLGYEEGISKSDLDKKLSEVFR